MSRRNRGREEEGKRVGWFVKGQVGSQRKKVERDVTEIQVQGQWSKRTERKSRENENGWIGLQQQGVQKEWTERTVRDADVGGGDRYV